MGSASDESAESPLSSPASSPLSFRSKSPTPPCDYPSPSLTLSGSRSPSKTRETPLAVIARDGPPPKKKRKLAQQRPRTTEYLDLTALDESFQDGSASNNESQMQRLLKALRTKHKIIVIAGAGISVSAGIPDFRSSTGLFKTLRGQHKLKASGKHLFDASVYKSDSSTSSFHDMIRELSHLTRNAKPTPFHHMLATLAQEGRLMRLYTQNVDGIDTALEPLATHVPLNPKGPWPKTIQLHGGLEKMVCTKCGDLSNFDGRLFDGPEPPSCKSCEELENTRVQFGEKRSHGIGRLRPRIVLYNEYNPEEEAIGAVTRGDLRSRPDAVIVVGTSLKIPGVRRIVREMCTIARGRRDGFTAWINCDPEPTGNEFKDCWDLVVRGDCDEVARRVALPIWNDKKYYNCLSDEDVQKAVNDSKPEVIVEGKNKIVGKAQGILTPVASPRHQSPTPAKSSIMIRIPKMVLKEDTGKMSSAKTSKLAGTITAKKRTKKVAGPKPSNKITNAFGVTKVTSISTKPAKAFPTALASSPNLATKQPTTPMRPVSPVEIRNNSELRSYSPSHDDDSELLKHQLLNEPSTPLCSDFKHQNRQETISPKGALPNNMAHLIDTD